MSAAADKVGELLRGAGLTVSVAESCTGGLVGHLITAVSGSSAYFAGGTIAYSNRIKREHLGVGADVLRRHGAVSEPVARQMAVGIRRRFKTDLGIGLTGVAGPGGGTPLKPVGLVHIAVAGSAGVKAGRFVLTGDRSAIRRKAARRALDMLRDYLIQEGT